MMFWQEICGAELVVWTGQTFGSCFLSLALTVTHVCLAVISAFCAGYSRASRRFHIPMHWVTKLRIGLSFLLLCCPIIILILSQLIIVMDLPALTYIMLGTVILSWFTHLLYLRKIHVFLTPSSREVPVLLSVIACGVAFILELVGVLQTKESSTFHSLGKFSSIVSVVSVIIYLIVLLIPLGSVGIAHLETLNNSTGESEPLLHSSYVRFTSSSDETLLGTAEEDTNCFSRLVFWWVGSIMKRGYQGRSMEPEDLYDLPRSMRSEKIVQKVERNETCSLMLNLHRTFGREYYLIGVLKLFVDMLAFSGPILLNYLVAFIEDASEPVIYGYLYAILICLTSLVGSFCSTHFNYLVSKVGMKIRAAVITLVYKKTLSSTVSSFTNFSTGQIVNLMTTDADRIVNFCQSFHQVWSLLLQVAITLYLLYLQVGLAFLAGLIFAILLIPVNRIIAVRIARLSERMMTEKDTRIKLMSEVLRGIRMVKMHSWEGLFQSEVQAVRLRELKYLKMRKYLDALCVYFWATTPVLISILTFVTYVLLGNKLTAAKVFTSLALFNILIMPLNAFPWVVNGLMEAWVSVIRVQNFLSCPTFDPEQYYAHKTANDSVVSIASGIFQWTSEDPHMSMVLNSSGTDTQKKPFILGPINLTMKKGQLVGVIGHVGSGKSTLIAALLGELSRSQGIISLNDTEEGIGLVSQEPWLQRGTIRSNIIFGRSYHSKRYQKVLECCALVDDIRAFPAGDMTEVGEEGQTLSGGQKCRVALARAVYQNFNLYLLDDPLSSLDAHISQHVFEKCIMGVLASRSRLLCTHHVHFLRQADYILVLQNGQVVASGPPSVILNLPQIQSLQAPQQISDTSESTTEEAEESFIPDDGLVEEETREFGTVKFTTIKSYWISVGTGLTLAVLLSLLLMQGSRTSADLWLAYWVSKSNSTGSGGNTNSTSVSRENALESKELKLFLSIYGSIAAFNSLATLCRAFLFAYGGIVAAVKIHGLLLSRILKAPLSFFESTPLGRILNRFSSDIYSIDDSLPFNLNILLAQMYSLGGTIIITTYGLPSILLVMVPMSFAYYSLQQYYRWTSRELKRLGSVTLSPIYCHFSETLGGLAVIRSFKTDTRFREENIHKLDVNQQANFASLAAAQWLDLRLQMIGVAVTGGVALLATVQHHFRGIQAGFVGLALSYALSITSLLNGGVKAFTDTEKEMVSMERVDQYIKEVNEEEELDQMPQPPYGWPSAGVVKYVNVNLRYRPGLPLALHHVSFEAGAGMKIGILGRTGSGKSSLLQALFRITPIEDGSIYIDGINIHHIDVHQLRSRLAVIPQDPFVFSSSVQFNLDPRKKHLDEELWKVLEQCHLSSVIRNLGGLGADIGERGHKLSLGQRQLLCLARALVNNTKILCMDEATAGIDQETDYYIQQTIRSAFRNTTILMIAHRVETVMDCDEVIIMADGEIVERGQPSCLMEDLGSRFYALAFASRGGITLTD